MSETVWISLAPNHGSNIRRITNSFAVTELGEKAMGWGERNSYGDPFPAECFPKEIFGTPDSGESDYRLPDIFSDSNFWVVSKAAADVLRQFDLGAGNLYPVKVLKKDRQTAIGDEWFCLNFGNKKQAFIQSESSSVRETYIREGGVKGWITKAVIKDGDIAVSHVATQGPDIWIDTAMGYSFFLSDALGRALKKAKADKGFFLHKCRVL